MNRIAFTFAFALAAAACYERPPFHCSEDSNCDLRGGGRCVPNPTSGDFWCQYPDPECPSGSRWSEAGDGLSDQCVDALPSDAGVDGPSLDASLKWSTPMLLANVNSTAEERFPAPSKDGLELYFARLGLNPPYGEIYVARRTSTSQPFGTPTAVAEVNGSNSNEIFAVPSHSGLELFVSAAGIITRYTRSSPASQWGSATSTGITANFISLSPDDLTMYIVARCPMNVNGGNGPCFFQSTRSAVGAAWSTPTYFAWDGSTQWNSAAVSSSGLALLVSENGTGSGVSVAVQHRANTTDAWSGTEVISAFALETTNKDARWNATDNEVYLTARPTSNASNGFDIYISVLQ